MGYSKNLMIAMYPFVEEEELDDFLMEQQADELNQLATIHHEVTELIPF